MILKKTTTSVKYEARLNRTITRYPYNKKTIYLKGTVIWDCGEKTFNKITKDNLHMHTSLGICEGYGVYEYFDLDKDIEFVKITTRTVKTTKEKTVKLKG